MTGKMNEIQERLYSTLIDENVEIRSVSWPDKDYQNDLKEFDTKSVIDVKITCYLPLLKRYQEDRILNKFNWLKSEPLLAKKFLFDLSVHETLSAHETNKL